MPLWCAHYGEVQSVTVVEFAGDRSKIGVGSEQRAVCITVSAGVGGHRRKGPSFFRQARRVCKAVFLITIVAESERCIPAALHLGGVGHNIYGATHRSNRKFGGSQPALNLNR